MLSRSQLLVGGLLVLLGVSGCPVTDDFYIASGHAVGGSAGDQNTGATGSGAAPSSAGAKDQGGTSQAGSVSQGGTGTAGDVAVGGVTDVPAAGQTGGTPPTTCVPTTERCNGHDDNCNDVVDELACNSSTNGTTGCSGFVLSTSPNHGYMLCTTNRKDWSHARDACQAQDMRLAWLETTGENKEVSKKITALSTDADVLFGATDAANEGYWFWYGGTQFWQGNEYGKPTNGAFDAWGVGTPNDANGGEDCAVLHPMTATWGDRICSATYAYLCEEPN